MEKPIDIKSQPFKKPRCSVAKIIMVTQELFIQQNTNTNDVKQ